jgi:hypothetical protein
LTADQVSIVQQAIAFEGYPPQSGPNGYPPSYQQVPNGGTPPGNGGGSTSTGKVNPATGLPPVGTVIYGPWLVQNGQSQNTVAAHFGISPSQIQGSWNVGNVVRIPWLVKAGQTIDSVAKYYDIPAQQLASSMTY